MTGNENGGAPASGGAPSTTAAPASTPSTDTRPDGQLRIGLSSAMEGSYAQAISVAEKAVAAGMDPAKVEALLRQGGFDITFGEDTRTDGQKALDKMGAAPPNGPGDYRLNVEHRGREGIVEAFAEHSEMTNAFYQAQIPARMGQDIYDAMKLSERQVAGLSGADLQMWKAEQKVILGRIRSLGSIQDATLAASIAIGRFPEATRERLLKSGALDSAEVVTYLAMAGRAIVARENA